MIGVRGLQVVRRATLAGSIALCACADGAAVPSDRAAVAEGVEVVEQAPEADGMDCPYDASTVYPAVLGARRDAVDVGRPDALSAVHVVAGQLQALTLYLEPYTAARDVGVEYLALAGTVELGDWVGEGNFTWPADGSTPRFHLFFRTRDGTYPDPREPPLSSCETWYADLRFTWVDRQRPSCSGSFEAAALPVSFGHVPAHCQPPPVGEPFPHEDSGD